MTAKIIKIPILVRNRHIASKGYFALRPIFDPITTVIESRFEKGIERLKKKYLQLMNQSIDNKKELNDILFSLYHPTFKYKQIPIEFKLENIYVKGHFSIIIFEEAGFTFVQLPFVNDFTFIAKNEFRQKAKFIEELTHVLYILLSELKETEQEDFVVDKYYSTTKEFIHYIELPNLFLSGSFTNDAEQPFSLFGNNQADEFDGLTELYKVGVNYSDLFPDALKKAFFQEEMIQRIKELIFNPNQSSIVLLGERGIGKHTLISSAIFEYMTECKSHGSNSGFRDIWSLDPIRLIAGMSYVGSWQRRLSAITDFLQTPKADLDAPNLMLIDNPVAILNIGKSAKNDMAIKDVLKPLLEKKSLPIILLATPDEWKYIQEKDRSFSTLFQVVRLEEPTEQHAVNILLKKRAFFEREYDVVFTINAIGKLVELYRGFRKEEALPGSLVSHLERIASKNAGRTIDIPEVMAEFSETSGLSDSIIGWKEDNNNKKLESFFERRIIGQKNVINALVNVCNLIKAKLTAANKPYSSFLFVGPTGVGKTQAAKALAEYIMGSSKALIRFDMNEFIDYYAVERLIGSASKAEGLLTEKLRHHPYGVVLFDEIEKGHPAVLDLMLQILDEGQLTDGAGRKVDFSKVVIIMTSNVGAASIDAQVGFEKDRRDNTDIYLDAIKKRFRPEWVNRIDEIIAFNPLAKEHLYEIAHLQIKELLHREGFVRRMTILNIEPEVLKWISDRGYNPKMGGRALKRQIENDLTKLTADYLINVSDNLPIIFSITLGDEVLVPKITHLKFPPTKGISLLPEIPLFERGGTAYGKLLRRISKIEKVVTRHAPIIGGAVDTNQATSNWKYYDFHTKVIDLKTELMSIKNGFNDNNYRQSLSGAIRSRYSNWQDGNDSNPIDALQEKLSHNFFKSKPLFDIFSTEYLLYLIQLHLLEIQSIYFAKNQWEEVDIQFSSLVQNRGHIYMNYIFLKYKSLFSDLKILKSADINQLKLTVEGYGIKNLVQHENGIHLFLSKQGSSIPIRLAVNSRQITNNNEETPVCKVYQDEQTMLDLNSGLLNLFTFSKEESLLMFYVGLLSNKQ